MRVPLRALLPSLLLAGCPGPAANQGRATLAGTLVALQLEARAPGGEPRLVPPDQPLRDGEQTALTVASEPPAYFYVAQALPKGTLELLWPPSRLQPRPEAVLRVPPEDRWMAPERPGEQETLYVVASARPLQPLGPELCRHLHLSPCALPDAGPETRGASEPPPPPPPPSNISMGTRALRGEDRAQRARAGKEGVAVLKVVLRYR